jgi:DNA-binding MarR family transcriptional regulator
MDIEKIIKANFKSAQQKAIVHTQLTAGFLAAKQGKFMATFDLSMAQFNILRILRGSGKQLTISTIKSRMVEKSPNTTRLLDKLLEKGFIKRKGCDEDKRQSFVEITESGLEILQKIDEANFSRFLEPIGFSDEDADKLSTLLDKLRASF